MLEQLLHDLLIGYIVLILAVWTGVAAAVYFTIYLWWLVFRRR